MRFQKFDEDYRILNVKTEYSRTLKNFLKSAVISF